jgi:hypothetical protein
MSRGEGRGVREGLARARVSAVSHGFPQGWECMAQFGVLEGMSVKKHSKCLCECGPQGERDRRPKAGSPGKEWLALGV